jgi:5-methylcytosine-specific restriction endonuclease McrA
MPFIPHTEMMSARCRHWRAEHRSTVREIPAKLRVNRWPAFLPA